MSHITAVRPALRADAPGRSFGFDRIGILGLTCCAIAVLWGGIFYAINADHREALSHATQNAENISRAFEESTDRSITAIDQALLSLRRAYLAAPAAFDFNAWATDLRPIAEMTFLAGVIDKNGTMIAANVPWFAKPIDLTDRPYFVFHRDNPRDELLIGPPVAGRADNRVQIQITRRISAPDGSFAGIVIIGLDPRYLARFFETVDLGPRGTVGLIGLDGILRARTGAAPGMDVLAVGRSLKGDRILQDFAEHGAGHFIGPSPIDGIERIWAYRGVHDYPLLVNIGIAAEDALAPHNATARMYALLGGLVTTMILAITALFLRHARRMRELRDTLRHQFAEKSEFLETTLERMSQGIMLIDAGNRLRLCNDSVIAMFNLPRDLVNRQPAIDEVLQWLWEHGEYEDGGDDFDAWLKRFRSRVNETNKTVSYEHVRPNGMVLEVRAKLLASGNVVRSYADITERKLGEDVLRAARDEARRATRAKSEFLATMSHEIRSPLSGLIGVLDLLTATELAKDQAEMAGMARNSASMLLAVLNDVLDFSKIEAGALAIAPEPTALRRVMNDLVRPHISAGRNKGVEVTLEIDADVPDHVVTDGLRLCQIVGNLVSNALKFTAAGRVAVRVSRIAEAPTPTLRVCVRDTGIGMSDAVVKRLFQPFMQADGSTTRKFGGTGLGLSISLQLARMMGGGLSVTSTEGMGSEFRLTTPCAPCAAPDAADGAAAVEAAPVATPGRAWRALVVDDDKTNRWLLQRQLQKLGLIVETAEDGEGGLEKLSAASFDLLVTDCHMPRMDGVALTRAVRAAADAAVRAIPVVGVTADTTDRQRAACRDAGMTELAIKPLRVDQLRALVERLLPAPETAASDPAPVAAR